ncbi:hypothetical protein [Rhizobacter sp. Root404]|uniref:hypothetical protein n=1 Tax=Rhizobacter sp. Root404 TaxID=1736528 RepID=UPI0006FCE6AD|nr:hypothetical protein [Rhizobacter sp. Root404]KQW36740.1 hypothetical protein ASC76_19075 [Rhizobacter sp. Root404]
MTKPTKSTLVTQVAALTLVIQEMVATKYNVESTAVKVDFDETGRVLVDVQGEPSSEPTEADLDRARAERTSKALRSTLDILQEPLVVSVGYESGTLEVRDASNDKTLIRLKPDFFANPPMKSVVWRFGCSKYSVREATPETPQ